MAPFPAVRLQVRQAPFTGTGIDCFGSVHVLCKRSNVKRWNCLFTCLTVRAVHIEIPHSLDVNSFINALRRFIARRGKPKIVYSDNGTNFAIGGKELRATIESWKSENVTDETVRLGIDWHFSPPSAPHFGGIWELLVQSAKRALYAVLKERVTTDGTLLTVNTEVEAFLNARPLTHISADPNDGEPLTPKPFSTWTCYSTLFSWPV